MPLHFIYFYVFLSYFSTYSSIFKIFGGIFIFCAFIIFTAFLLNKYLFLTQILFFPILAVITNTELNSFNVVYLKYSYHLFSIDINATLFDFAVVSMGFNEMIIIISSSFWVFGDFDVQRAKD